MIEYAQMQAEERDLPNVHFQVMNATQPLALPDQHFDLVNMRFISGFMQQTA